MPRTCLEQRGGGQRVQTTELQYRSMRSHPGTCRTCLEQRGDGERGDAAVLVADERLHVDVAVGDRHGVAHGHLAKADSKQCRDSNTHKGWFNMRLMLQLVAAIGWLMATWDSSDATDGKRSRDSNKNKKRFIAR